MGTAPQFQKIITQVLEKHGLDLAEANAFLWLALPQRAECLIIEALADRYLSVALATPGAAGHLVLDPQLFFAITEEGWMLIHIDSAFEHSNSVQFLEAWAIEFAKDDWLTYGKKLPEPTSVVDPDLFWATIFDAIGELDSPKAIESEESVCGLPF